MSSHERLPYGEGIYRRRIRLVSDGPSVTADLEDDFHRFRVVLRVKDDFVLDAHAVAKRYPWSTCPEASQALRALRGMPLSDRCTAVRSYVQSRMQCTHMLDLAGLAVAHAGRRVKVRQYDAAVPDRIGTETRAVLARDGEQVLAWITGRGAILEPWPYAGRELARAKEFVKWCEADLEPDVAEAALVLHRACHIAWGRSADLDAVGGPGDLMESVGGTCYAFMPGVAERGTRVKGSTRELTQRPEALLDGDEG